MIPRWGSTPRLAEWKSQCRGYNRATLFLGDMNTGTLSSRFRGLESETVKYDHEPAGLGPENNCSGEDQQQL
jgi:hypothetical protein